MYRLLCITTIASCTASPSLPPPVEVIASALVFAADSDALYWVETDGSDPENAQLVLWCRDLVDDTAVVLDRIPQPLEGAPTIILDSDMLVWGHGRGFLGRTRLRRVSIAAPSVAHALDLTPWCCVEPILVHERRFLFANQDQESAPLVRMDLDTGESDERFPLNTVSLRTARVFGDAAFVVGRDQGGEFLASFAPLAPTGLHVILRGLRDPLPPVLHDGALDVVDNDYAGQNARLYRLGLESTGAFELVVDLSRRRLNSATWVDDAVWVSSVADASSTLTRIGATGEQVEFPVPYAPVQLVTSGNRLIVGAYRPDGGMQVFVQPLE